MLATQLSVLLDGNPAIHIFSKHNQAHRAAFGFNELLYDVPACRVGAVASAKHKKPPGVLAGHRSYWHTVDLRSC